MTELTSLWSGYSEQSTIGPTGGHQGPRGLPAFSYYHRSGDLLKSLLDGFTLDNRQSGERDRFDFDIQTISQFQEACRLNTDKELHMITALTALKRISSTVKQSTWGKSHGEESKWIERLTLDGDEKDFDVLSNLHENRDNLLNWGKRMAAKYSSMASNCLSSLVDAPIAPTPPPSAPSATQTQIKQLSSRLKTPRSASSTDWNSLPMFI